MTTQRLASTLFGAYSTGYCNVIFICQYSNPIVGTIERGAYQLQYRTAKK